MNRKENLIQEVLRNVRMLWESKHHDYNLFLNEKRVKSIECKIIKGFYNFRPMYRSFIPNPNSPGELWRSTLLGHQDPLILHALSFVMESELQEIYIISDQFCRVGAQCFFSAVESWPRMEYVVRSSVLQSLNLISHKLLLNQLTELFGKDNQAILGLLGSFLSALIIDQDAHNYEVGGRGIPFDGCLILSWLLMNFFLHQLDLHFVSLQFDLPFWDSQDRSRDTG